MKKILGVKRPLKLGVKRPGIIRKDIRLIIGLKIY